MSCATHSYSADLCPDTGKPCVEFCDPAKGDQCSRTNEQISTMTEAQKAAYWFDLYLEETTKRRKLEEQLRQHGPSERDLLREIIEAWEENLTDEATLDIALSDLAGPHDKEMKRANDSFERLRIAVAKGKSRLGATDGST